MRRKIDCPGPQACNTSPRGSSVTLHWPAVRSSSLSSSSTRTGWRSEFRKVSISFWSWRSDSAPVAEVRPPPNRRDLGMSRTSKQRLSNQDERSGLLNDFADLLCWDVLLSEGPEQRGPVPGRHCEQQATGGLGVEEQVPSLLRDSIGKHHAVREEFRVAFEATGEEPFPRVVQGPRQELGARRIDH